MSVRVVLALRDPAVEALVLGRLRRADAGTDVVRRCVDLADLVAVAGSREIDAVVVSAQLRGLDRDAVAALHRHGLHVVLVTSGAATSALPPLGADAVSGPDPDDVLSALRAPQTPVVTRVPLEAEPSLGGEGSAAPGRVVTVWGPIGAPGRTTVAVTVADELARTGQSTLLVDADTYGASVAVRLGLLDDASGLAAACRRAAAGALDTPGLAELAVGLGSGLRVLTGLPRADRWSELRPAALDEVLTVARSLAEVTVVDCAFGLERPADARFEPSLPTRDGAALAAVGAADTVLCVGHVDPVGLVRLLRAMPSLREAAPTAALVGVLVVGAAGGDADGARRLLAERAGLVDVVVVPEDARAVAAAEWSAQTLGEAAPRSPARAALAAVAARVAGVSARPRGRRRRVRRPA